MVDPIDHALSGDHEAQRAGSAAVGGVVLRAVSAIITATTSPWDSLQRGIRLLRAVEANDFAQQFQQEVDELTAAGKIKADYLESSQARVLLGDAADTLANKNLDDDWLFFGWRRESACRESFVTH